MAACSGGRSEFKHRAQQLGKRFTRKGEFKAATDYYLRALEIDPAYADAHFNLGTAYVKTNQWQAAVEQYAVGLKYDPNNARARHFLGQMYVRGDDLGKAIEQFSQSLSLAPGQSAVHADLGVALALQGNFAEAVEKSSLQSHYGQTTPNYVCESAACSLRKIACGKPSTRFVSPCD